MRFALAGLLALVIGSQADAQLIRRYSRSYTPGYASTYYTAPSYYTTPGTVITSGYYSPYTWSNNYVTPSSGYYYSSPAFGYGYSNYGYRNYGYSNFGYRNYGGWGRRGYRW